MKRTKLNLGLVMALSVIGTAFAANNTILKSGKIQTEISPDTGRIISFSKAGGQNLLWFASQKQLSKCKQAGKWMNYGGDKIWPSQQVQWFFSNDNKGWPPDKKIDGSSWKFSRGKEDSIILQSPFTDKLNINVTRIITPLKKLPGILIKNEILRNENNSFPVHIWSVTQIKQPLFFLLNIAEKRPNMHRHFLKLSRPARSFSKDELELASKNVLVFKNRKLGKGEKIGSFGNWLAAIYEDTIFVQITNLRMNGCYPDGANLEIFVNAPEIFGNYSEMEILSPNVHLKKDEKISNKTLWLILDKTPQDSYSKIISKIEKYLPDAMKLLE